MKTIKRLDLFFWFEEEFDSKDIKKEIKNLFQIKGIRPLSASWGITEVPEEDVGECPWEYLSSTSSNLYKGDEKD